MTRSGVANYPYTDLYDLTEDEIKIVEGEKDSL